MSPRNKDRNEQMRTESLKKITDAALRVFAEYGYHGATMKKITKATGLSYGLVYHYFPSKEKIFLHLIEISLDNSRALMDQSFETVGSAWDRIKKLSELVVTQLHTEDLALQSIIVLQAITQAKDIPGLLEFINERTQHYKRFDSLIIQAQKDGDVIEGNPDILSAAYLSLAQGLSLIILQEKSIREDEPTTEANKISPEILNNLLRKR